MAPRREPKKSVVSRRGRRRSRTVAVTRRPNQTRQVGRKHRQSTQSTSRAGNPTKRARGHVSKLASLPYRSPTPPKKRESRKLPKAKPATRSRDSDDEDDSSRSRSHGRSRSKKKHSICRHCGRPRMPKSILKRRNSPYPEPRKSGRRAKRIVKIFPTVQVWRY